MKIFYVVRDASRNKSTEQVVAFCKSRETADALADALSKHRREGAFHTLYKEMEGTPQVGSNKGVKIYACLNLCASEMIVDSIHADSESAEKALNQGRGATPEYMVYKAPLLGGG